MPEKNGIFISWSGPTAEKVAAALNEWLKVLLAPEATTFFSPETPAGEIWGNEIRQAIMHSAFGILVVTPDNRDRPWLMWEAGALRNLQPEIRVAPFLFHLRAEELPPQLRDLQAVAYKGKKEKDAAAFSALIQSIAEEIVPDPERRKSILDHADARAGSLSEKLVEIRQPASLHLHDILRDSASGIARLKGRGLAALNSFGFGAYTNFVNRIVDFLGDYEEPACDIFNTLQPRSFIGLAAERLMDADSGWLSEEAIAEFLSEHASTPQQEESPFKEIFPSLFTIAAFAEEHGEACRRLTILTDEAAAIERSGELGFFNQLIGATEQHHLIREKDARLAVDPHRLHQSDFAIWKSQELVVLTDYYPDSSTLIVAWKHPREEDAFIDYYAGVFNSVFESPSTRRIKVFMEQQ